jgi:hypothetical protein
MNQRLNSYGSTNQGGLTGINSDVYNYNTATILAAGSGVFYTENSGAGTLTSAYGTWSYVDNKANGIITNAYGITTGIRNTTSTGSITNGYGIYIASSTGNITTRYGLYQDGPGDTNYFAGRVGVGTTTPGYDLTVNGTLAANLASGNGNFVCFVSTTKQLVYSTTACSLLGGATFNGNEVLQDRPTEPVKKDYTGLFGLLGLLGLLGLIKKKK